MEQRSSQAEQAAAAKQETVRRIGDYAKQIVLEMEQKGQIAKLPVKLTDAVYYPAAAHGKVRFCIACGKHGSFRFDRHLLSQHGISKRNNLQLYEVYEQLGRGVLERMKAASVDLSKIPQPRNQGEWLIFCAFYSQLQECGIPLLNDQQELSRSPQLEEVNICPEEEGPSHVVKEGSEQVIKDEQLHQGSVPPTQRAPFIPRANLCITANIADDLEYRGRSTIHHVFTDAPEKTLMFAHEYDTSNRNEEEGVQEYFVQKYPVLQRSTGRLGETMSVDDAIYSCEIVKDFFAKLQDAGVPVGVRSSFAKAVLSFYKFLQLSVGVGAGRSRHDVIEDAIRRAEYEVKRANDEKKEIITFRDIAENRAQVGSYPLPKHYNRVREPTSRSGGYFVVDKKCKEWLDHYGKLREHVCRLNGIEDAHEPLKAFFIQWNGRDVTPESARSLMTNLFSKLGCGELKLSCNTSRRGVARMEYEKHMHSKMESLSSGKFADKDISNIQSHRQRTQEEIYVDRYQLSCVYGYIKLKLYAEQETNKSHAIRARVAEVMQILKEPPAAISQLPRQGRIADEGEEIEDSSDFRMESDSPSDLSVYNDIIGDYDEENTADEFVGHKPGTSSLDVFPSETAKLRSRKMRLSPSKGDTTGQMDGSNDDIGDKNLESSRRTRRKSAREAATSTDQYEQDCGGSPATAVVHVAPPVGVGSETEGDTEMLSKYSVVRRKTKRGEQGTVMKLRKDETATPADIIVAPLSPATQTTLSSARATTLRAMDEEGQEEGEIIQSGVLARGAAAKARFQQSEEAKKRERYASQLPEIANPAKVLDYMREFNSRQYSGGLGYFQDEYEQQCFNLRRVAQPIQDFPWLEIRDIPSINGKGLFAKVNIQKDQVVSDYRGKFVTKEELEEMKTKMNPTDSLSVGDYEVEFLAHVGKKPRSELKSYSILAHNPIYKGAVTLGRLCNHSSKHPNLYTERCDRWHPANQGEQMELLVLFRAKRKILAGEQILWNYGRKYSSTKSTMECLCRKCSPNLASSTDLQIPVPFPRVLKFIPSDDDSHSQQTGIRVAMAKNIKINARAVITASNVLRSLNVKTRIPGLVPNNSSDAFADLLSVYRHSRLMFLGHEDDYPTRSDLADMPPNANTLLQLLCVAYRDAYEKSNPVVLVLKHEGGRTRLMRKKQTVFVVLLGEIIGPIQRKRYGNCIIYDESQNRCQTVVEQTEDRKSEKSLLQMFGEERLIYFPRAHETMWIRLRNQLHINVDEVLKTMDEFDPNRLQQEHLQHASSTMK
ncbi:hypothetical protein V3C99_001662 [Haemonchus contortus]